MADLCSYPGGCTNSMTVHQKNVTERLYGKPYCIEHQDYANQEASEASDAVMIDIKPYTKNGWEIDTRGNACKTIDGKDVRINIAYVDSGRKKTESISINKKPYIYGDNINVDIEINRLFKEIKPHDLINKGENRKDSLSNESESKNKASPSLSIAAISQNSPEKSSMQSKEKELDITSLNKTSEIKDASQDNKNDIKMSEKMPPQTGLRDKSESEIRTEGVKNEIALTVSADSSSISDNSKKSNKRLKEESIMTVTLPSNPISNAIVRPAVSAQEAIAAWKEFNDLKAAIINDSDRQRIGDRSFIKKSGWRKLAAFFNLTDKITEEVQMPHNDGGWTWKIKVTAIAPNGRVSEGVGICSTSERKFAHVEHDTYTTAHTRAKNRAISDMIAGGEVSAEEVE